MQKWLIVLMIPLLAGCSESAAPSDDGETLSTIEVQTGKDVGAVSGVVVDETIVPVADATVKVIGQNLQTTTNAEGQFVFEDMAPGVYFLNVTADQFIGVQQSVTVEAGVVSDARVLLARDFSPVPYHDTVHFQGFMQLYLSFASFAVEVFAPGAQGCTCVFMHEPSPGAQTLVLEVYGEPSIMSNPTGVYGDVYWEMISQDNPDTEPDEFQIHSAHDYYPVYVNQAVASWPENTKEWEVRLTGSQWFHLDESYDLFLTTFYVDESPEGWKFNE